MTLHTLAFRKELYTEHLEEAGSLYATRLAWLDDPEIGWLDLDDFDNRMEAHLDALILGEGVALQLCQSKLADADVGLLHAITRVFCRHKSPNLPSELWQKLDYSDPQKIRAVADALKWEIPAEWHSHLLALLRSNQPERLSVAVPAVVYQSLPATEELMHALRSAPPGMQIPIIGALGRLARPTPLPNLRNYLASDNDAIVKQAALALLRMGDNSVMAACRAKCAQLSVVIAIGGSQRDTAQVLNVGKAGVADADCLIAMGMSGDVQAIETLLNYLRHPKLAMAAATGLQLLSGAGLYETAYMPEKVEEGDLFEHELEDFKKGNLPRNVDGQPFGEEVQQLTTDHATWLKWFNDNQTRFTTGLRYRSGKPYSPASLVDNLISNHTPQYLRPYIVEELTVRYGMDIPLECDDRVAQQKMQMNKIYRWVTENQSRFDAGAWYFAGRRQG